MEEVIGNNYLDVSPVEFIRKDYFDTRNLKKYNSSELEELFKDKVIMLADPDFLYDGNYRLVEVRYTG